MPQITATTSGEQDPTDNRTRMWTLATRVHGVIANEAGTPHAAIAQYLSPSRVRGGLSERELALCDWGVTFGVALAFALRENAPLDPPEPLDALYRLARSVANIVEQHHGGAIPPRPSYGVVLDRVITAFEDHGTLRSSASEPTLVTLDEALQSLTDTYGTPWNGID